MTIPQPGFIQLHIAQERGKPNFGMQVAFYDQENQCTAWCILDLEEVKALHKELGVGIKMLSELPPYAGVN